MNHKVANSHIRRKVCLEKALGRITHTCMRPDTGKQRREHRKEPLRLGGAGSMATQDKPAIPWARCSQAAFVGLLRIAWQQAGTGI